jgi:hypothetical protein
VRPSPRTQPCTDPRRAARKHHDIKKRCWTKRQRQRLPVLFVATEPINVGGHAESTATPGQRRR